MKYMLGKHMTPGVVPWYDLESALYRLEGGWIGDFYEFFTEEFAGEEIP